MSLTLIYILTAIMVLLALYTFLKYGDEWLIIIVLFFISSGLNRYNVVIEGKSKWVTVAYSKGVNFFKMTDELGLEVLGYFALGSLLISAFYTLFKIHSRSVGLPRKKVDTPQQLANYLRIREGQIIIGFFIFIIMNGLAHSYVNALYATGGLAIAFGVSYFLYFGMALGGMILLMYMSFQAIELKRAFFSKIFFGVLLVYSAISSYDPNTRFQFLSWSVALGIIFVKEMKPLQKLRYYLVGAGILIVVFSAAGVARHEKLSSLSLSQIITKSLDRAGSGEDSNMLDGFMMVMQVYPQHLNFQYGLQHFEILLRPIPRALWAGKPLGSYVNKLGLNDNMQGASVGISESIYGTFYGEGGFIGILVFCILYAYFFVRLFKIADKYESDIKYLIKGMILASTVPLLRGGDLPGIVAFVGMTYWPVFVFIYSYNKFIATEARRKRRIENRITRQQTLFDKEAKVVN